MLKSLHPATLILYLTLIISPLFVSAGDLSHVEELIKADKSEQALEEVQALIKQDPEHIEARFLLGLLLTKTNRVEEAEQVFQQLTRDKPGLPEPYNNLAVIYAAQGRFEEAKQALSEAINTHPSYATAHENLGDIYAKMASRAYNQALELDVDNLTVKEKLLLINELFSAQGVTTTSVAMEVKEDTKKQQLAEQVQPESESVARDKGSAEEMQQEKIHEEQQHQQKEKMQNAIFARIDQWVSDWSAQDVGAYLSHYSSEFKPPKNLSLKRWKEQRELRLKKPGFIRVTYESAHISVVSNNLVRVSFRQAYQSDTYSDRIKKELTLRNENDDWLIVEEKSL